MTHHRKGLLAALIATLSTVAAFTLSAQQAVAAPAADPGYSSLTAGLAPHVHAAPGVQHGTPSTRGKGARRLPRTGAAARSAASPVATAAASAAVGQLLHNFNGTSSRDSEVTNFNARFEPPDQALCTGNGFVLEAVNSAFTIFRANGSVVRGPFNVNDLFNEGSLTFTSDPRCYFDASTNTWFAIILYIDASNAEARIDVAVNATGDPTNAWQQFHIDTTDDGKLSQPANPGCPCFGDQPRLGIDRNNLYLSTDEFSILGTEYNGGQLYAVAKKDLIAGASTAHFVHYANLSIGGAKAGAIEPATTTGAATAEYFLNALDPNLSFDNRLGVWAITGGEKVATGGRPTLSRMVITSEPYGAPPSAVQKYSSTPIDAGDDRMQQAQYINGTLWGELDTGVTIPNDPAERAGAAWFAVHPSVSNGRLSTATISRQGYVVKSGNYLLYPALQADAAGRAAMVFTLTGPNHFPSAAYAVLPATGTSFGPVTIAAAGTGPYDPDATRWGDYSYATLDPSADAVWMATEYIPPKSSQTSTGQRNWGTRVTEVALS